MKVSDVLKEIRKRKFLWFSRDSICSFIELTSFKMTDDAYADVAVYVDDFYKNKDAAFSSWGMYSGNRSFPVPGSGQKSAPDAYFKTVFKWNPLTKYGRARRHLLNHLIVWFSERGM